MVVIALTAVVGGAVGLLVTRDDPDHAGRSTASTTAVIAATVAPPTTAPAATVAPSTTAAVATGPNVLGIVDGTPADPASARPEERFAAHLGRDDTEASPATVAALYASWWKLFLGPPADVAASPDGFTLTDGGDQTIELSSFVLGADGKVADLVECVRAGSAAATCNRLSNAISLDSTASVVGQSANVTFQRLGELRLLRARTIRFVALTAAQPVTAATSAAGEVHVDGHILAFAVPSDAVPPSVDVQLTYADGTSELVTISV